MVDEERPTEESTEKPEEESPHSVEQPEEIASSETSPSPSEPESIPQNNEEVVHPSSEEDPVPAKNDPSTEGESEGNEEQPSTQPPSREEEPAADSPSSNESSAEPGEASEPSYPPSTQEPPAQEPEEKAAPEPMANAAPSEAEQPPASPSLENAVPSEGISPEEPSSGEIPHVDFDLLDTEGRWLLKVLSGPNTGAEFAMHGGSSYIIGTDTQTCDIVFQDLSVSRKHAKLTIDLKDNAVLEDLQSRNCTFVDGEKIDKKPLSGNVLVSMGTTTFLLLDREAERTTIVAGITPEKKEEPSPAAKSAEEPAKEAAQPLGPIQEAVFAPLQSEVDRVKEEERLQAKLSHAISSLVILAIVTGLIMIIGIGGALLFRTEQVTTPSVVNPEAQISKALSGFPAIRYSYNPTNNRLLLVGHVLTTADRSKMLDILQQLKFIRDIDYNNVVIDELVWREINQVLAKNPDWRGITISSPTAGRFVVSGFLHTRSQAEELFDYLSQNFAYVDLLERKIVVEQELLGQITRELNESGFRGVTPSLSGGDLILNGSVGAGTKDKFQKLVTLFRSLPGIRSVQAPVSEAGQREAVVDLSSKYRVTGLSTEGKRVSVVINGRILAPGDSLDGMYITEISSTTVYLEKDGVKYKIDFNH
jgi:type III secretion system YscD/HrpQ family protein